MFWQVTFSTSFFVPSSKQGERMDFKPNFRDVEREIL